MLSNSKSILARGLSVVDELPKDEQPIVVNPSATGDMLVTGLRQIVLVVGGAGTVIGFAKGHDVKGAMDWILSSDFAVASSAALTISVFVYGQARVLWNKRKTLTLANRVPDSVAVVVPSRPLIARLRVFFRRLFQWR